MDGMLRERLEHQLKEELSDTLGYNTLAEEMSKSSFHNAWMLFAIRNDEYDHAMAILEILEADGYDIEQCPEVKNLWEKIKELN